MNEPTNEELEALATQIYWNIEHGEMREAVQRLRDMIDNAFNRGADE